MKPPSIAASLWSAVAFAAVCPLRATPITPDLVPDLTVTREGQYMVLGWFGENGMTYQVEVSPALTEWASSGPVINGSGAPLTVPILIAGQSRTFFRVLRLPGGTISASYSPGTAVLTITGDGAPNAMVISRDAAGLIRINNGAVTVQGGSPTVANTIVIQVFGREGNDQICLDESNGALPRAQLSGEAGDDTLTGGSGADTINGGPGFDTLLGKGGADTLIGGDDDDTVTGGTGGDTVQLGNGNDRFIWNPGDGTDLVEGGDGTDTVEVNGGTGAEDFTTTANTPRVRFDRVNPAPFSLDIGTCEHLLLNASGGNDTFAATGSLSALIQITVDGGAGDDTINGSNGNDRLIGGDHNDFIDGNQGTDMIIMGAGNDVFQWDPGDGNDTVEGEAGADTLLFNGSGGAEIFDISANGTRLRFFRNLGNITLDVAGIETVQCNALGNADTFTVNDITATEVTAVNIHLAGTIGGSTGDAQPDAVILHGTAGVDTVTVTQAGTNANIAGLKPVVSVFTGEATDTITINTHGDNDTVDASGVTALFALTIDGGPGNDTIAGSLLGDTLNGGDDHDTITGRQGDDTIIGGTGDDTFIWNPGDANDVLEGQAGTDKLLFNGSSANENIDLSANGPRFRFFRDVANVTMDCDDVEKVEFNALGGTDTIVTGDLTATDVNDVIVDLAGPDGGGDLQSDSIVVTGTQGIDAIAVNNSPANIAITGLPAVLTIVGAEAANDRLTINSLGDADTVNATGLAAGVINLTVNGGLGNDMFLGSHGGDTFSGGDGNDTASGGPGDDTFVWNPGDDNDTLEGQAGIDTMLFNGANVAESIELSSIGPRLRFFRNVANVVMDCGGVEQVVFNALGGADTVTINDLTGTGVTNVSLALGATLGSNTGDLQPDNITVTGTGANDTVLVIGSASGVSAVGLSTTVAITGSEAANDRITLNVLAGDDTVDASGLSAGAIGLTVDGGIDDDILIGSGGPDILLGGDGDDVLIGGPGLDTLNGGTGNNTIIPD